MPPASDPFTGNLPGLVLLILILAIPLAFLASISILHFYRRAVLQGMRTGANAEKSEPASVISAALPGETVKSSLQLTVLDPSSPTANPSTATGLYNELLRGPWRAAVIYSIAGLCYSLVTTLIFLRATGSGFHLLSFLIVFWYYAWPVVVTVSLIAAATWRTKLIVFASYFLIIVALGALAALGNSTSNWLQIIFLWLFTNFPAALLLLIFLNRRVQAVGPLVLTFMIFAVAGSLLLPPLIGSNQSLTRLAIRIGLALGFGDRSFLITPILGFALSGALGWLVLRWIGSLYRRKKISEQSITLDAIWLLFGIFQSIGLIFEGEFWFLASLLSFLVYKGVAWVGFALTGRNKAASQRYPALLVLRVFSLGRRSERLFDVLSMHWRFTGSIRLIAGPDLATTTMEPHEFLDFLSGKLARRFIDNAQTLDLRLSQTDLLPDPDGQFRVNDFFCHADTWRTVLSRLVRESDAVIMDLRGFSSQNAGCIFEISELVNLMALGRVLFIMDRSTDEAFLNRVLQQAWDRMSDVSPNRLSAAGSPALLRLNRLGDRELKSLLSLLAGRAASAPGPQAGV